MENEMENCEKKFVFITNSVGDEEGEMEKHPILAPMQNFRSSSAEILTLIIFALFLWLLFRLKSFMFILIVRRSYLHCSKSNISRMCFIKFGSEYYEISKYLSWLPFLPDHFIILSFFRLFSLYLRDRSHLLVFSTVRLVEHWVVQYDK